MTKIAEGLADERWVGAICSQPTYSKRGTKAPRQEVHNGVEIVRVWSTTFDKNVIPLRVVNMLTFGLSVLLTSLQHFRAGDRVLVVTTPPLLPFAAMLAAVTRGCSVTLLIHDNYPEILIAAGKSREDSAFVRLAHFANRWLYKNAARIIVVGRDMRELVAEKAAGLDVPITTIPNWAELESVSPAPRDPLLAEMGLSSKFVFLYAGNMGWPNDLETLIEAAGKLKSSNVHFVFLGAGVKRAWLEREVERRKLENVTIIDPRPRSEQQIFLNACDVGIVSLVSRMKGVSMPSRTYNILAAGKPVLAITERGSETDLVVTENNIGRTVAPGDTEAATDAINSLAGESPAELEAMGRRAREAAERDYSLETAIRAYREAIN
ncbi:MAG TPA: glycosyltransferase family 4 protein [Pyrinomonadaceae bacterium]|nr:glycosyltransferase family 4 protein [Pyrinomonadaceae bacterium]